MSRLTKRYLINRKKNNCIDLNRHQFSFELILASTKIFMIMRYAIRQVVRFTKQLNLLGRLLEDRFPLDSVHLTIRMQPNHVHDAACPSGSKAKSGVSSTSRTRLIDNTLHINRLQLEFVSRWPLNFAQLEQTAQVPQNCRTNWNLMRSLIRFISFSTLKVAQLSKFYGMMQSSLAAGYQTGCGCVVDIRE